MAWPAYDTAVVLFNPSPMTRLPLTPRHIFTDCLPLLLCYYLTALLAILPNTFPARLALLPVTLWLALKVSTTFDIALACGEPRLHYLNYGLILVNLTIAMRAIEWTAQRKLPRRQELEGKAHTDERECTSLEKGLSLPEALTCAWDLSLNLRGVGWTWSKGLYVPPDWRSTSSRTSFLMSTLSSLAVQFCLFDLTLRFFQKLFPTTIGSIEGGTIFNPSLSLFSRYLVSSVLSVIAGTTVYTAIQVVHLFLTIVFVLFLRQSPLQWPPLFDSPWCSTSLSDFWGRRWHQLFRRSFIVIGFKPLYPLFGGIGGVLGAFFVSGLFHDWGMWGMGHGTDFWSVVGFFLMMGIGIILESIWERKLRLGKVGGWPGWLWTVIWAVGWANIIVDAWLRRGLAGSLFLPEDWRPTSFVERWIGLAILYTKTAIGASELPKD